MTVLLFCAFTISLRNIYQDALLNFFSYSSGYLTAFVFSLLYLLFLSTSLPSRLLSLYSDSTFKHSKNCKFCRSVTCNDMFSQHLTVVLCVSLQQGEANTFTLHRDSQISEDDVLISTDSLSAKNLISQAFILVVLQTWGNILSSSSCSYLSEEGFLFLFYFLFFVDLCSDPDLQHSHRSSGTFMSEECGKQWERKGIVSASISI